MVFIQPKTCSISLPFALADRVARICGWGDRRSASLASFCANVWRNPHVAGRRDDRPTSKQLSPGDGRRWGASGEHQQRRLPFAVRGGSGRGTAIRHQPVSVCRAARDRDTPAFALVPPGPPIELGIRSVVDACVSFSGSPHEKLTVGITRSCGGRRRAGILALKTLQTCHASSTVPSTVEMSSDIRAGLAARGQTTASKKALATSPCSNSRCGSC